MELTSGFINLNKPSGISSAAAVSKIKRLTGLACGHMGTLDPLASGVLPVAFGNASRLFNYLLDKEKVYRAVFRFGTDTDTLDSAGEILKSGLPVPTEDKINSVLSEFVGEIEQVPPIYSAKSVGGVRAYRLARQGKEVELSAKRVTVHSLVLLGRLNETDYARYCRRVRHLRGHDVARPRKERRIRAFFVGYFGAAYKGKLAFFCRSARCSICNARV